jgi:type IV pilus assembly protein PilM
MPAAGLDISDTSIKAIVLEEKNNLRRLVRYEEVAVPVGSVVNGEIKNAAGVIEALKLLQKKINYSFVYASLPEEKTYVIRLEMPILTPVELRAAIELQIPESVPLAPDQIIFDYEIIRKIENPARYDVAVTILPKESVLSYTSVLEESGFTPLGLEIEGQSLARALIRNASRGNFMLVDFGKTRTSFSIVADGLVVFTSGIMVGGQDLTKSIGKEYNLSEEAAETKKRKTGLLREGESVFPAMVGPLSVLTDELAKVVLYWQKSMKNVSPTEGVENPSGMIIFSGGEASLPGLIDFLSVQFEIPLVLGNPWENVLSPETEVPDLFLKEALRYAPAIGLSLRSLIL